MTREEYKRRVEALMRERGCIRNAGLFGTVFDNLSDGVAAFSFTKSDGTERTAYGTRNVTVIGDYGGTPKGGREREPDLTIPYYDLEKGGWRSFRADRLTSADTFEE